MYQLSLASSRSHAQNRKLFTALTKLPKCEYYMPWGSWKCPRKWVSLLFGVNPLIFADFGHMQKIGFQQVTGPVERSFCAPKDREPPKYLSIGSICRKERLFAV